MALPTQTTVLRNGWLDALALDFAFYSQPSSSQFSNQYRIGKLSFFTFVYAHLVVTKEFIFSKESCKALGIEKFHGVMKKLLLSLSAVKLSSSEFVLLKVELKMISSKLFKIVFFRRYFYSGRLNQQIQRRKCSQTKSADCFLNIVTAVHR